MSENSSKVLVNFFVYLIVTVDILARFYRHLIVFCVLVIFAVGYQVRCGKTASSTLVKIRKRKRKAKRKVCTQKNQDVESSCHSADAHNEQCHLDNFTDTSKQIILQHKIFSESFELIGKYMPGYQGALNKYHDQHKTSPGSEDWSRIFFCTKLSEVVNKVAHSIQYITSKQFDHDDVHKLESIAKLTDNIVKIAKKNEKTCWVNLNEQIIKIVASIGNSNESKIRTTQYHSVNDESRIGKNKVGMTKKKRKRRKRKRSAKQDVTAENHENEDTMTNYFSSIRSWFTEFKSIPSLQNEYPFNEDSFDEDQFDEDHSDEDCFEQDDFELSSSDSSEYGFSYSNEKQRIQHDILCRSFEILGQYKILYENLLANYLSYRKTYGEQVDWSYVLNCSGYIRMIYKLDKLISYHVLPHIRPGDDGKIIMIKSLVGKLIDIRESEQFTHLISEDYDVDNYESHQAVIEAWQKFYDSL